MNLLIKKEKFLIFLIFIGYLSLFINLNLYEFRNEESLRVLVAFEMKYFDNYLQPTVLGENYYLKPPLFNWLIVLSSFLFNWSEFTARFVSLVSLGLTLIGIGIFSYSLLRDKFISILSPLIFLTFIDVLFWYGYLAEIDMTLTFIIFLTIYFQILGFIKKYVEYIPLSGFFIGLAFLLKGFPAYLFYALTFIGLVIYTKRYKEFFKFEWWSATIIAIIVPMWFLAESKDFYLYLHSLLTESLARTEGGSNLFVFFKHLVSYPLLNFKQLLPTSIFILISFYLLKKSNIKLSIPSEIKLLLIIVLINYLPYLLAVESRGRYILPLFPFIAIIFSFIISKIKSEKFFKIFTYTLALFITLRLALGIIGFPLIMKFKESRKEIAYDISKKIDINKKIAFDCFPEKSVAVYLDFLRGKPVLKSNLLKDWEYLITCNKLDNLQPIEIYKLKKNTIYLYKR